jgi:hypothetical protein
MKWLLRSRVGLALALLVDLLTYGGRYRDTHVSASSMAAAMVAQARVTDEWLAMEGVVGTAVGMDSHGDAVLKVYLTAPGAALLPQTVAGVDVTLEVTGRIVALEDAPAGSVDPKVGFPRPVPIGVSTGHPNITAGTIGARVTDGTRVFALSNNHVFAANNQARPGDNLLQPGVADGGRNPDDAIATLHDYEPIGFCSAFACPYNRMDAALALTTPDELGNETPEDGYGSPRSRTTDATLGMSVQKYGRTTGHTQGRVTGINAVIDVDYRTGRARFENQIMISGDGFSTGGDSGSLIVTKGVLLADRRPVGLLFAGSATNTIANPIDVVLSRFDVRIDGS